MRTQRPTSDWRVAGAFADTNTKFKKNTINVIDEGRRVGQQSTKTLTTRSSTKTQNNKIRSALLVETNGQLTHCQRVADAFHDANEITVTMKCKNKLQPTRQPTCWLHRICSHHRLRWFKRLADYQLKLFVSELSHLSKSLVHVRQRKVGNVNILTWYRNSTLINIDRVS